MDILKLFEEKGALLSGHFLLTSGLHSNRYFQCALLLQHPEVAEQMALLLAEKLPAKKIDCVVSPAVGGIVIGQEMGRALKCRAVFTERADGTMVLRRGFSITPGEKVCVVEDVVTTGGTTKELVDILKKQGCDVVCACSIVDRSSAPVDLGVPYVSLCRLAVETYQPDDCPLCRAGGKPVKPGSRK